MKVVDFSFCLALVLTSMLSNAQTPCPGGDGGGPYYLEEHGLQWCDSNSSGNNEGAACGAEALSGVNPTSLGDAVLSNTWSRTNMMGAAKAAARAGAKEQAVNAAICCQIHNPHMHGCMASHRDEVYQWLKTH